MIISSSIELTPTTLEAKIYKAKLHSVDEKIQYLLSHLGGISHYVEYKRNPFIANFLFEQLNTYIEEIQRAKEITQAEFEESPNVATKAVKEVFYDYPLEETKEQTNQISLRFASFEKLVNKEQACGLFLLRKHKKILNVFKILLLYHRIFALTHQNRVFCVSDYKITTDLMETIHFVKDQYKKLEDGLLQFDADVSSFDERLQIKYRYYKNLFERFPRDLMRSTHHAVILFNRYVTQYACELKPPKLELKHFTKDATRERTFKQLKDPKFENAFALSRSLTQHFIDVIHDKESLVMGEEFASGAFGSLRKVVFAGYRQVLKTINEPSSPTPEEVEYVKFDQHIMYTGHLNALSVGLKNHMLGIERIDRDRVILEMGFRNLFYFKHDNPDLAREHLLEIARQLFTNIAAIHRSGMIHHDIKPENVICLNERISIDRPSIRFMFGDLDALRNKEKHIYAQTYEYAAYELFGPTDIKGEKKGRDIYYHVTKKANIFSIGLILLEVLWNGWLDKIFPLDRWQHERMRDWNRYQKVKFYIEILNDDRLFSQLCSSISRNERMIASIGKGAILHEMMELGAKKMQVELIENGKRLLSRYPEKMAQYHKLLESRNTHQIGQFLLNFSISCFLETQLIWHLQEEFYRHGKEIYEATYGPRRFKDHLMDEGRKAINDLLNIIRQTLVFNPDMRPEAEDILRRYFDRDSARERYELPTLYSLAEYIP
jgi:serine/threonine protein kinase